MADIIGINQRRVFEAGEAERVLPVVRRITQEAVTRAEQLAVRYEALPEQHPARPELEKELNDLILGWAAKIQKLGADAKGLWLVDFDGGAQRLGWRYPESELREL